MKTILVDDEINAMEFFRLECAGIQDIEIVACFDQPLAALDYARENPVDLAVLDIAMPGMDGITLGKELKALWPNVVLIYISAYDEYAIEAYRLRAPVYLEKPYNQEDVAYALETAKQIAKDAGGKTGSGKNVFIRTFGYFDVFANDALLHFHNKKSKELLAYLVDRNGAAVTNDQAIAILWEDAPNDLKHQSKLRRVMKDLRDTLSAAGIEEILLSWPNSRAVDTKAFKCDYYWLLKGNQEALRMFGGAYMSEYSWAEETVAYLTRLSDSFAGTRP